MSRKSLATREVLSLSLAAGDELGVQTVKEGLVMDGCKAHSTPRGGRKVCMLVGELIWSDVLVLCCLRSLICG